MGGGMALFALPAPPGPLDDGREFEPFDDGAGRIGSDIWCELVLLVVRAGYPGRGGAEPSP